MYFVIRPTRLFLVNVYNTYASTFTGKKPEKQAKNDAFHALLVIKGGENP